MLLIPFWTGTVVAAVSLGTATRKILSRSARDITGLAIPIWALYFVSVYGRSLLATKGFSHTLPGAHWCGVRFGKADTYLGAGFGERLANTKQGNLTAQAIGQEVASHLTAARAYARIVSTIRAILEVKARIEEQARLN